MFLREKNIDANVFDNTLQHRKTLVKQCTKFLSSSSGNLVIGISETLALLLCSFHLFTATSLGHNPQSTIQPFPPASLITMKFHQDVNRTSSQDCCCGRTWCSLQSFLLAFSCDSLQTRPRWSETWFLWQMVLLKLPSDHCTQSATVSFFVTWPDPLQLQNELQLEVEPRRGLWTSQVSYKGAKKNQLCATPWWSWAQVAARPSSSKEIPRYCVYTASTPKILCRHCDFKFKIGAIRISIPPPPSISNSLQSPLFPNIKHLQLANLPAHDVGLWTQFHLSSVIHFLEDFIWK